MDEDKRRLEQAFWQLGRELDILKPDHRSNTHFPFVQLERLISWLLDRLSTWVETQVRRFLARLARHPRVQRWRAWSARRKNKQR